MPIPDSPPNPISQGASGAAPAELPVDDQLRIFWQKNGNSILAVCCLLLLGVLGKGVWDYRTRQQEISLQQDFAAASITAEKLRVFADDHSGTVLGGLAQLELADSAYSAGLIGDALAGYQKAAQVITSGPLAARIQLGLAMAEIQAGQVSEGESGLRRLLGDAQQSNPVRVEAGYDLASSAAASGRSAEVEKIAQQIMQIDPESPWAQRAFALASTIPPRTAGLR